MTTHVLPHMAHVQGQTQRGHVGTVAPQDGFGPGQEFLFLEPGVRP